MHASSPTLAHIVIMGKVCGEIHAVEKKITHEPMKWAPFCSEHSGPTRPSSHGGQLREAIRTAGVPRPWFHSQQEHQVERLCVTGSPRVPDGSPQPPRAVEPGHLRRPQVKASQTRGRHHRHGYDDEAAVPPGRAPSWCVSWCSWGSTTRMLPDAAGTPQWGSVASKAKDKPTDRPLCVQRSARLRLPGSERSTQTGSR